MPTIPTRLIANEAKVQLIETNKCGNCYLFRRTDLRQIYTPGGEIGADVWSSKDIFGMSLNIYPCNSNELKIECYKDDVNIVLVEKDYTKFISNEQLYHFNIDEIEVQKKDTLIIFMSIKDLLEIEGTYPFKAGTLNEENYNYRIGVYYDPLVLNVFHFLVEVISDETGEWKTINRKTKKNYQRSLATKIRAKLLNGKKVKYLILSS